MCLHLGTEARDNHQPHHLQWVKASVKWNIQIGYLTKGKWRKVKACSPLSLDVNCLDITKFYKQVILLLCHYIPGAKQEIETLYYIHITSLGEADD